MCGRKILFKADRRVAKFTNRPWEGPKPISFQHTACAIKVSGIRNEDEYELSRNTYQEAVNKYRERG